MTLVSTGSGRIAARLSIEGLEYEFVTDPEMVGAGSDGRSRVLGLLLDGLVIDNGVDMIGAMVKSSGITAKIVDIDEAATAMFAKAPTATTYLRASCNDTDTLISADSVSAFDASGYVHIGTECIYYAGFDGEAFDICERGKRDTIPQSHFTVDGGASTVRSEIINNVVTIEGRRARLFIYGDDDDFTGDGVQRFLGIVSRDATLSDITTWTVTIDPITRALAANIGDDLSEPLAIRGIYYPCNGALYISLNQTSSASYGGGTSVNSATIRFCGFFETQAEFVAALNVELAAATSGWSTTVRAIEYGAAWTVQIITSTTVRWLEVEFASPIDDTITTRTLGTFAGSDGGPSIVATVLSESTYTIVPLAQFQGGDNGVRAFVGGAPSTVPRASVSSFGYSSILGSAFMSTDPTDFDNFPANLLHLSTPTEGISILRISEGDVTIALDETEAIDNNAYASSTFRGAPGTAATNGCAVLIQGNVPLTAERRLMEFASSADGLTTFLDFIIANSPLLCNLAAMPLVSDVFAAGYYIPIEAAQGGRDFARRRLYKTSKKAKLEEYLAHELKLIGLYPYINLTGQVEFRPVTLDAPTASSAFTIDASNELVGVEWSRWERNALGSLNEIRLLTGYNADEDKHTGPILRAVDLASLARNKTPRVMEIAPKSVDLVAATVADLVRLAGSALGIYGRPYAIANVTVPWTLFEALPGDIVTITSATLPASSGARGLTDAQGIVLHRRFELGQAHGTLTLLVHGQNIAGYTPSILVASQVNTVGNTWQLNRTASTAPFEENTDRFAVGDSVRICRWLSETTTADRSGFVVSKTSTQLTVTFDSAWTPGASTWVVEFDDSDDANTSAAQLLYAYVAASDAIITLNGSEAPARTFAP